MTAPQLSFRLGRRRTTSPRRARHPDRGSTTVEAAGYTALMLLAVTVLVQAAVWALADLSARHAAHHGVQTARLVGGSAETGHSSAAGMLAAINPHGLTDVDIQVERGPATTTVTITGTALRILPVVTVPVQVRTHGPTEPDLR